MYHAWTVKRKDNNTYKCVILHHADSHVTHRTFNRYKSTLFPRQMRGEVAYYGALDKDHKPHGYGVWMDNDAHGENLKGWWVHGRPQGPFISRITGTVNTFIAVRIGFACTTKKWNKSSCGVERFVFRADASLILIYLMTIVREDHFRLALQLLSAQLPANFHA